MLIKQFMRFGLEAKDINKKGLKKLYSEDFRDSLLLLLT
jgi:hypothetical protein